MNLAMKTMYLCACGIKELKNKYTLDELIYINYHLRKKIGLWQKVISSMKNGFYE